VGNPLAAFWAEALRYEHEDIDAFVSGLVDGGRVPIEATVEIDGKRRWRSLASLRHPDDPVDERGAGAGRRILFQAVLEAKSVKNRVHPDLIVGPRCPRRRGPPDLAGRSRGNESTFPEQDTTAGLRQTGSR